MRYTSMAFRAALSSTPLGVCSAGAGLLFFLAGSNFLWADDLPVVGTQLAAAEMPHVAALLRRPVQGVAPTDLDPLGAWQWDPLSDTNVYQYAFDAYLDTGTSGVLISQEISEIIGIQNQMSGSTKSTFRDITVDGTKQFYIGEKLYLSLAPYPVFTEPAYNDKPAINATFSAPQLVRPYLAPEPAPTNELGEPQVRNVVGMPALIGKTMVVDARAYNHLDQYLAADPDFMPYIQTSVHNPTAPEIPHTDFTIKLSYSDFSDLTETAPNGPGIEPPTLTHNPFIGRNPRVTPSAGDPPGVSISRKGASGSAYNSTGSWLLDTGAQVSFMSSVQAGNLGFHIVDFLGLPLVLDDNNGLYMDLFWVPISGADPGSVVYLPGVYLDDLVLPGMEGKIDYKHVPIVIADIQMKDAIGNAMILDGDIGMNLFLPSSDAESTTLVSSAFDYFVFDEAAGQLRLATVTVPEPTALLPLVAGALLLLTTRRYRLEDELARFIED